MKYIILILLSLILSSCCIDQEICRDPDYKDCCPKDWVCTDGIECKGCGDEVCNLDENVSTCSKDCVEPQMFTIAVHDELFNVMITDPEEIELAKEVYFGIDPSKGSWKMIIGDLALGNDGYNADWSWHLIPNTVRVIDSSIEVCDGTPSHVENNLKYWMNVVGDFCPWASKVVGICGDSICDYEEKDFCFGDCGEPS
ncbi:hypothetical protein ACFLZX_00385 [Nanoarchaeota archaeon]